MINKFFNVRKARNIAENCEISNRGQYWNSQKFSMKKLNMKNQKKGKKKLKRCVTCFLFRSGDDRCVQERVNQSGENTQKTICSL